jgi:hypothetical protein
MSLNGSEFLHSLFENFNNHRYFFGLLSWKKKISSCCERVDLYTP